MLIHHQFLFLHQISYLLIGRCLALTQRQPCRKMYLVLLVEKMISVYQITGLLLFNLFVTVHCDVIILRCDVIIVHCDDIMTFCYVIILHGDDISKFCDVIILRRDVSLRSLLSKDYEIVFMAFCNDVTALCDDVIALFCDDTAYLSWICLQTAHTFSTQSFSIIYTIFFRSSILLLGSSHISSHLLHISSFCRTA